MLGKSLPALFVFLALAGWGIPRTVWAADHESAAEHSHAAESGSHGGGHEDPNPLIFSTDLAVWTLVVFLLLLTILRKFAWGPIVEALEKREQGIADHIAAAERQNADARRLLAEYEQRLANAQGEVRELLEEARRDAEHTKSEILGEAKAAAQAEHDRALREIRNATDGALKQLAETSANLAVDLASKVISEKLDGVDHARLVREAMGRFPDKVERN